jgi:1,4-alpha-glucan branching enzyme
MRKSSSKGNGQKPVSFQVCAQPGCAVYVAGSFNDWKPGAIRLKDVAGQGIYQVKVKLPPGRHEYKFMVNEVWCVDPAAAEVATNGYGSLNSVLQVH